VVVARTFCHVKALYIMEATVSWLGIEQGWHGQRTGKLGTLA